MKAQIGQPAADFVLTDVNGAAHRLSQNRGKKIILSFYRDAGCPFCNLRIYELTKHYKELQKRNTVMIPIFHSDIRTIRKYVGKIQRPFPLLADPDQLTYKLYDVEKSIPALMRAFFKIGRMFKAFSKGFGPSMGAMKPWLPVDVLIDENLIVRDAFYSPDATSHIPMDRIVKFVNASPPDAATGGQSPASAVA